MLKPNRVSIALAAAALIILPTLLTAPANAQTKVQVVAQSDQDRDGRSNYREDRSPRVQPNWNRGNQPNTGEFRSPRVRDNNWNRDNQPNTGEFRSPRVRDNNWNRDN